MGMALCLGLLAGWSSALAAEVRVQQRGEVWVVEDERLEVRVEASAGALVVRDKACGYTWQQPPKETPSTQPRFRDVQALPNGLSFEADFGATKGRPNAVRVSLTLVAGTGDVSIVADMADRSVEVAPFPFLEPFLLDTPSGVLAIADYCNGHIYPLDTRPFPRTTFSASRLDMPWVGLCDLEKGFGYALILETSDDATVRCNAYKVGEREVVAPQILWQPSKGRFAYPRRLLYRFVAQGGYVALAKAYRAYAQKQGLWVTLAEKARRNPNLRRLFGAPDVWGNASLSFAREAKSLGVEKMLIHGRTSPQDMKAINELGYLTSEYDNYTDILPLEEGKEVDSHHDLLPDHAVLRADGQRMTAWLTWDKKTQFMKRCPARWLPAAQVVIPKVLAQFPFLGRFIDVTTAEDLYECYDERHPLTRSDKRRCGEELLGYVRSLGLVVGGEHGIWWAVPHLDYIEGMMSCNAYFSWPAGHLIRPKSKEQEFVSPWGNKLPSWEVYEKWGIGHQWRVPLWELVFHDCIVSTWYWGDSSDFLLQAAPEITPKKDAFNILYGTIPLLWASREGSWQTNREVFLRTYRNTCKLHEVIAGTEMLSHEFLTPDHAVQRTLFSDGTEVIVNFGEKPYPVRREGKEHVLPQNGWLVRGPRIEQSLELRQGQPVTTIRTSGYLFTDAGGVELTLRSEGEERLRLHIGGPAKEVLLRPKEVAPRWDMASTRIFLLDERGERRRHLLWRPSGREGLLLGPFPTAAHVEMVCGSQAAKPDLWLEEASVKVTSKRPRQGEPLRLSVTVRNGGGAGVKGAEVAVFADAPQPERRLARQSLSLASGEGKTLTLQVDTTALDGPRRLLVVADVPRKVEELCRGNNEVACEVEVLPDWNRWPHRLRFHVEAGEVEREDEVVVLPLQLPQADPASVRVALCDEQGRPQALVPTQFEGEELCFLMPGRVPAGARRSFLLLWDTARKGPPSHLSPLGRFWNEVEQSIEAETYRVAFEEGHLVRLAAKRKGVGGSPFLAHLILSSRETGWIQEPGTVERFEVRANGPVRTVVFVRKALQAGVVYEKTYLFYPRHFEVRIRVNKPAGNLYSRAFYLREGHYVDDKGNRAQVDGQGEGENIMGKNPQPRWYAVYAQDWAHACIALSPCENVVYWDAGSWGGIGFLTTATHDIRFAYVVLPGATDAAFAEEAYKRLTNPARVKLEEVQIP